MAEILEKQRNELSVGDMLSEICLEEARELKHQMLRLRGRYPMAYDSWSFHKHILQTPIFGEMTLPELEGSVIYGYQAYLVGDTQDFYIGSPVKNFLSNPTAYADFNKSYLSLEKIGVDNEKQIVLREQAVNINTDSGQFYNGDLSGDGYRYLNEDKAAELRVIIEYGLQKLGVKPKRISSLAQVALRAKAA